MLKYDFKKQLYRQKINFEAKQSRIARALQAKNNKIIVKATQDYVNKLQDEMQLLVKQTLEFQQEIKEKNEALESGCKMVFALEQRVIGYATKYFEAKVAFDVSKAELDFLKRPKDPDVLGLDARVDRYLDEKAAGTWQDPRGIEDLDEALKRPLRFYGGHCALSMSERVEIAEDQVCCYYKCRIKDMTEAGDHTKSQMEFLLNENKSLRKEVLRLEAVEEYLRKKVAELEKEHEDTLKVHAQKLEKITDNHFIKMKKLKADMKNQQDIFEQELELSE